MCVNPVIGALPRTGIVFENANPTQKQTIMKRNITLALVFFLTFCTAFAQRGGRLFIQSENAQTFYVVLNGQKLNQRPQAAVLVTDLMQRSYDLTVILAATGEKVYVDDLAFGYTNGAPRQVNYQLKWQSRRQRHKLDFVSMVPVDFRAVLPRHIFVVGFPEQPAPVYPNPQQPQYPHQPQYPNPYPNQPVGCPQRQPMAARDFADALATVKKQSFDDTKLKIARQIIAANCMSTNQIVEMTRLLTFERNKLDFAQFAFDFCTDPSLYFKVNDVFNFSSSAEALTQYIQNRS